MSTDMNATSLPLTDAGLSVYRRLLKAMLAYRLVFVISIMAVALDAAGQGLFFYLLRPLIDETIVAQEAHFGWWLPGLVMGAVVLRILGNFGGVYGMEWVGRRLIADMRQSIFSRYLQLPSDYFDQHAPGQMISVVSYNAEQVAQGATTALIGAVRDVLTVTALLAVMLIQSWRLTMAMLLLVPVIFLVVSVISVRFRRLSTKIQDSMGDVTHLTEEAVLGHEVIKVYGGQSHEAKRFAEEAEANRRLHMKLSLAQLASSSLIQLAAGLAVVLLLALAASDWLQDSISAGIFMSVLAAMVACIPPLKRLTRLHVVIEKAVAAATSIFEILDAQTEVNCGTEKLAEVEGQIQLAGVSFRYGQEQGDVLDGIELTLKPGTLTALVGRSGSGKSTLMKLIPRFYQPTQGVVRLDGLDIRQLDLDWLRQHIALVSQQVVLFNDTVAANIGYGSINKPTASQIEQAALSACAMEFIEKLPQGFDTLLGPGGVMLSGGQRQRIAIARAILKDAPILLLDEATSALDAESERWVQQALDNLYSNRTSLVIAHQLATVQKADQVVVLEQGKMVEIGTHAELMALEQGRYKHLYHMQLSDGLGGMDAQD